MAKSKATTAGRSKDSGRYQFIPDCPIERLVPYEDNPRKNDQAVRAVAESIRAHQFNAPIIVGPDWRICAGHTRYKAATQLGLTTVPVLLIKDLTGLTFTAYNIADNQTASLAEWDTQILADLVKQLQASGNVDLEALGFSSRELTDLLTVLPEGIGKAVEEEVIPERPKKPRTRPGDLWILNDHRLLCGDAGSEFAVKKLMARTPATAIITDPPYNVAIGQNPAPHHRQRKGLENDALDVTKFAQFIRQVATIWPKVCGGDVYVFFASRYLSLLDDILHGIGYHQSSINIWAKDSFVLSRRNYQPRYEPFWYGWYGKHKSSFCGGRDESDVWECPRPRASAEHPTMKPVALIERAIGNSTQLGDIVFDPFLGSGTTIIAAERLQRRAYGMEIDPGFCDVIVKRWERLTGKKAEVIR